MLIFYLVFDAKLKDDKIILDIICTHNGYV